MVIGCLKVAGKPEMPLESPEMPQISTHMVNMRSIASIESSGNSRAYNAKSGARGLYQITPICLKDYLQYHNESITLDNLFEVSVNEKVAQWYMNIRIPQLLRHYGYTDSVENRLIAYNCGISCIGKKLPAETRDYVKKYFNLL